MSHRLPSTRPQVLRRRLCPTNARDREPGADSYSTEKLCRLFDWDFCFPSELMTMPLFPVTSKTVEDDYGNERNDCERTADSAANDKVKARKLWLEGIIYVATFLPRYHSGVGLIRRTMTHNWMKMRGIVSYAQHGLCCVSTVVEKWSAL